MLSKISREISHRLTHSGSSNPVVVYTLDLAPGESCLSAFYTSYSPHFPHCSS